MNEGNVIADFDSDLIGNGSHANLKVIGLSSGRQVQGIDTRVTNYGNNSVGTYPTTWCYFGTWYLDFQWYWPHCQGAKGADAQQESHVLMLS